jgi:polyhydroxyalkanoate synthesis regulator phasin
MAKKMKAPRVSKATPAAARAEEALRRTWAETREALSSAEAKIEKQARALLKRNGIKADDAKALLKTLRARFEKERRRGVQQLETSLKELQSRLEKERRHVARLAGDAVQSGLAALNIPSRREVSELTRKVDELSKKIDTLRKRRG